MSEVAFPSAQISRAPTVPVLGLKRGPLSDAEKDRRLVALLRERAIETDEGWILLTHGVGPVRKYSIGARLRPRASAAGLRSMVPSKIWRKPSAIRPAK